MNARGLIAEARNPQILFIESGHWNTRCRGRCERSITHTTRGSSGHMTKGAIQYALGWGVLLSKTLEGTHLIAKNSISLEHI